MTTELLFETARMAVGGLFVGLGVLALLTTAVGLLRFPDFFARMHAVQAGDGVGGGLILFGLAIVAFDGQMALRLGLLGVVIAGLSAAGINALATAAHAGGLDPVIGRYRAPRPGTEPKP
jgi:multicomponent Na+:H+ antiporter subunit G